MEILEVGRTFTDRRYYTTEGMMVRFNTVSFDLITSVRSPTPSEIRAITKGAITIGLYWYRFSVIAVLEAGKISFDAPMNFLKVPVQDRAPWINAGGNLVTIILVDQDTGQIAGLRAIGLNEPMVHAIALAMREQALDGQTPERVDMANLNRLNILSTKELMDDCIFKQKFERI